MTTKNSIKYASIDTHHLKNIETKKSSRKSGGGSGESKLIAISEKSCLSATTKNNRRSQSLDRLDENSGDSRAERRNRRQYMHLVGKHTTCALHNNFQNKKKIINFSLFVFGASKKFKRFRKRMNKLNN